MAAALCSAWVFIYMDHSTGGLDPARALGRDFAYMQAETGTVTRSGRPPEVDDAQWWALRFVKAVSEDHQRDIGALFAELEAADADEAGERVAATLEMVAETIRSTPRGYAVQPVTGRPEARLN